MNHGIIKDVIRDQHQSIRESVIVPRPYSFDRNANYVVVGLRRAGKSMLLYKLVQDLVAEGVSWERIIYINFEDERLSEMTFLDLNDVLAVQCEMSGEKGFFFFDEIQNIDGWEKFARRLADGKERVYITGSNAKMLSSEIETTLGGRFLEKHVMPFSFPEYLVARNIQHDSVALETTKLRGVIAGACDTYLHEGGFPESLLYQTKREYLNMVLQKIILGDIATRKQIRNPLALRLLIKKTAETVRNEVSYSKLYGAVKGTGISISKDTVIEYIGYALEAYLLFKIPNYYAPFSERESTPKYYFMDNGLLNLYLSEKNSALLENLVAIELYRNYSGEMYFARSSSTGIDVDFLLPELHIAIQACVSLNDSSAEREISNLIRLYKSSSEFTKLIIVTLEETGSIDRDGCSIRVISLVDFLFMKNEL